MWESPQEGRHRSYDAPCCVSGERLLRGQCPADQVITGSLLDSLEHRFRECSLSAPPCWVQRGGRGGVTVAHGEKWVTRGSGVPLPRGPRVQGATLRCPCREQSPFGLFPGLLVPGGPSLAPPVLRAPHGSSLASPPECREEPRRAFLHLL